MRKLLLFATTLLLSTALFAQKGKSNQQTSRDVVLGTGGGSTNTTETATPSKGGKESGGSQSTTRSTDPVWEGTSGPEGGGGKPSKNQPAKVRAAFARDYPNATGVSWSKYRGDWTASFNSGPARSTAVYHANGQRRDTRTAIPPTQAPRSILEGIIKKAPGTRIGDIVKIEASKSISDVFRIKTTLNGTTRYLFYNEKGVQVSYDY